MSDNGIQAGIKNPQLDKAYFNTCIDASNLRFRLSSKNNVSASKFNMFKRSFDFLFTLTGNMRGVRKYDELIKNIKSWLTDRRINPDIEFMQNGIELFDSYQNILLGENIVSIQ